MRGVKKVVVLLVAAGFLAASTAAAGGADQRTRLKPSAAVQFLPAVVVVGKHFKARERVKVSILGSTNYVRSVRSTALGTFRVNFGAIALNDCSEFTLKVVGALGSRFALTHPAKPC